MRDRNSNEDTGRPFSPHLEHAIELCAQWHDQTYRKSRWRDEAFEIPPEDYLGVPVVAHLTAVALTVQRAGWDDTTVAAALLHDVIEDRNRWRKHLAADELEALIGRDVTALVQHVSERKYDPDGNPRSWRDRKEAYIAGLRTAPDGAVAISVADKLHNLWTINESLRNGTDVFSEEENRRALNGTPDEQLWLVGEVLSIASLREDARFMEIRRQLQEEIDRFRQLTAAA
jgi:(p)ppGpp synthase/HD superfamily hydrolase